MERAEPARQLAIDERRDGTFIFALARREGFRNACAVRGRSVLSFAVDRRNRHPNADDRAIFRAARGASEAAIFLPHSKKSISRIISALGGAAARRVPAFSSVLAQAKRGMMDDLAAWCAVFERKGLNNFRGAPRHSQTRIGPETEPGIVCRITNQRRPTGRCSQASQRFSH